MTQHFMYFVCVCVYVRVRPVSFVKGSLTSCPCRFVAAPGVCIITVPRSAMYVARNSWNIELFYDGGCS